MINQEKLKIEYVPIGILRFCEYNPRKISEIARKLSRNKGAISRELFRHTKYGRKYLPCLAQKQADSNYYVEAKKVLDVAQRAYEIFEGSEVEEKRQFLQYMLQNSILEGRNLELTLQKPFNQLLEYTSCQAWLRTVNNVRTIIQ